MQRIGRRRVWELMAARAGRNTNHAKQPVARIQSGHLAACGSCRRLRKLGVLQVMAPAWQASLVHNHSQAASWDVGIARKRKRRCDAFENGFATAHHSYIDLPFTTHISVSSDRIEDYLKADSIVVRRNGSASCDISPRLFWCSERISSVP